MGGSLAVCSNISSFFFIRLHSNWPLTLKSGLVSSTVILVVLRVRFIWLFKTLAPSVELDWTSSSVKSGWSDSTLSTTLPTSGSDWRQQASLTPLPTEIIIRYFLNVKWSGRHSFIYTLVSFCSLGCHFVFNWHLWLYRYITEFLFLTIGNS